MHNTRTAGDGPEALLARSVPNLQLHQLVVHHDLLDLEVNAAGMLGLFVVSWIACSQAPYKGKPTSLSARAPITQGRLRGALINAHNRAPEKHSPNGGNEGRGERVLREAQQQAAFPHTCITHE